MTPRRIALARLSAVLLALALLLPAIAALAAPPDTVGAFTGGAEVIGPWCPGCDEDQEGEVDPPPPPPPSPTPTPAPPPPVSSAPSFLGVTLTNVKINGGANTAVLPRGSAFTVALNYRIVDPGCPGCIDQILVGYSNAAPTRCVYSGNPPDAGASGSVTTTFVAPSAPGIYYLAFDQAAHYSCAQALAVGWWNGPPGANRHFASISVV